MTIYDKIIEHSVNNSNVLIEDHLIEECSEFIKEICNKKRGRSHHVLGEMADVLFQIEKYLSQFEMSIDDLRALSLDKTNIKFPGLLDEL